MFERRSGCRPTVEAAEAGREGPVAMRFFSSVEGVSRERD